MKIAYLEDIPEHREALLKMVRAWIEEKSPASAVTAFPDAASFLFHAEEQVYDLLLLDILMPGLDGMALAERLRKAGDETLIVFISSEKDFVFEGYKVEALDYLLKPVRQEELWRVLDRAQKAFEAKVPELILETSDGAEAVRTDRIAAVEVRDKALLFTLAEPGGRFRELSIRGSLGEFQEKLQGLGAEADYVQIHRSYICNMAYIKRLEKDAIELRDGSRLPLARSRRKDVMKAYMGFRQGLARQRSGRGNG